VTLEVGPDRVVATRTRAGGLDPALALTVGAFIRLVWGRLDRQWYLVRSVVRARGRGDAILALGGRFPGHEH
jgi:hypothetical protein